MRYFICLTGFMLVLSSCHSDQTSTNNGALSSEGIDSLEAVQDEPLRQDENHATDSVSFELAFEAFFTALQTADTATFNQFIHPVLGLWVIEQPGAVPHITHVQHISDFKRQYQDKAFFTVAEEVKQCDLQQEPWPAFDCAGMEDGKSGYSKDGCFVERPDKFRESGYWNYASLSEAEVRSIEKELPLVQKSVLHTNTSFEFHFGFVDGHWRLLFAKLIHPCSA